MTEQDLLNLRFGDEVHFFKVDRSPFKVVGIREKEVELSGDWSGGTHAVRQVGWTDELHELVPIIRDINWSEPAPPTKGVSTYDHVKLDTPLGQILIEWKSWKTDPDYGVTLNQQEYLGTAYDLADAKEIALAHLRTIAEALRKYSLCKNRLTVK